MNRSWRSGKRRSAEGWGAGGVRGGLNIHNMNVQWMPHDLLATLLLSSACWSGVRRFSWPGLLLSGWGRQWGCTWLLTIMQTVGETRGAGPTLICQQPTNRWDLVSHPSLNIHQVNVLGTMLEVFSKGVKLPDYIILTPCTTLITTGRKERWRCSCRGRRGIRNEGVAGSLYPAPLCSVGLERAASGIASCSWCWRSQ